MVTPEGFPLAYEVMPGNTSDKTTLREFLARIEQQYGQAQRVWVMDRGIPSEEVLAQMRAAQPPIHDLVGTPRARVRETRRQWETLPWQKVKDTVEVKLFREGEELLVVARSEGRQAKEIAMRRQKLARLLWTLRSLRREKLKDAELDDGHYLLRSNLRDQEPEWLWKLYLLPVEIEAVFKSFKNDLGLRPLYHSVEDRVEAHLFVSFLAYGLQVTLRQRLRALAPGLTPRAVIETLAGVQMLEVEVPTTDGRWLVMSRYTQPDSAVALLLARLK